MCCFKCLSLAYNTFIVQTVQVIGHSLTNVFRHCSEATGDLGVRTPSCLQGPLLGKMWYNSYVKGRYMLQPTGYDETLLTLFDKHAPFANIKPPCAVSYTHLTLPTIYSV